MNETHELSISPDFTLDDIHKIREWNYERQKNMTVEEIVADTRAGAAEFLAYLAARKQCQGTDLRQLTPRF
jgi:hypothetical protein